MPTPSEVLDEQEGEHDAQEPDERPPAGGAALWRSAESPMVAKKASMKGVCSVVSKRTSTPVAGRGAASSASAAATPPATGSGMLKVRSGAITRHQRSARRAARATRRRRSGSRRGGTRTPSRPGRHPRRVGPEPFQVVEAARLGRHDVDHHVAEVEEHPAAAAAPLGAEPLRAHAGEPVVDLVGHGRGLPVAVGGEDDEVVGDAGEAAHVEDHRVLRLLVGAGGHRGEGAELPVVGRELRGPRRAPRPGPPGREPSAAGPSSRGAARPASAPGGRPWPPGRPSSPAPAWPPCRRRTSSRDPCPCLPAWPSPRPASRTPSSRVRPSTSPASCPSSPSPCFRFLS